MTRIARWLIDKSALRIDVAAVEQALAPRVARGLVGISIVTELEVGYSARSLGDYQTVRQEVIADLVPVTMPVAAEQRAREVQAQLVARGQHRAVSIPDLLVAAIAEVAGLTVLHYDRDFDLITQFTGQPSEWVVPAGTM